MAQRLDTVEARLDAILLTGRGGDNTLGVDAMLVAIPSGKYRRRDRPGTLRDRAYPPELFDRTLDYVWRSSDDTPEPSNEYASPGLRAYRLDLQVGYLWGESWISLIRHRSATGETQATAATYPHRRQANDGEEIRLALCFPGLFQVAADSPFIVGITPAGARTYEDVGPGRRLTTIPLLVILAEPRGIYTATT